MVLNYPNEWGGEDCLFILEKDDFVTQQDKDKLFIYNGNYNLSYSNCTFNDQEFRVISSLKTKLLIYLAPTVTTKRQLRQLRRLFQKLPVLTYRPVAVVKTVAY